MESIVDTAIKYNINEMDLDSEDGEDIYTAEFYDRLINEIKTTGMIKGEEYGQYK